MDQQTSAKPKISLDNVHTVLAIIAIIGMVVGVTLIASQIVNRSISIMASSITSYSPSCITQLGNGCIQVGSADIASTSDKTITTAVEPNSQGWVNVRPGPGQVIKLTSSAGHLSITNQQGIVADVGGSIEVTSDKYPDGVVIYFYKGFVTIESKLEVIK